MLRQDLRALIAAGESETLEFKSEPARDVAQEVAAFSSSRGGIILVGVADDGEIFGIDQFHVVRGQVQNWIHEFVSPVPAFTTSSVELDERQLLLVEVEKGDQPVYCYQTTPTIGTESHPKGWPRTRSIVVTWTTRFDPG